MKIQNNFSQSKQNNFGMAFHPGESLKKADPEFLKLLEDQKPLIDKFSKDNEIYCAYCKNTETAMLYNFDFKNKNLLQKIKYFFSSVWNSAKSEADLNPKIMPQNAESIRMPGTKNALVNALNKITGNK